uniref:Uncharacterized protein n=1 Tax=Chromera velia CCMP2878 TaxID=1169474 RepID=A0A0G4HNM4_9ALVE|eukprot:Cvel_29467.t1-p1 / transcript=Cvel_29467.t1 / gene=Cvel_29467 / organism=Chromera_velia_CCMP2878 / gene_product=Ribosomal RNA-processing protein 8, putative / transcript_product=Ribosomal RNA-processing protein 8, putative / location=Cvel_scaffold4035:2379-5797(-) / protein_length=840 / sequence_SO=supercontig / SO=protein_coding / is_pseudo=false
MSDAVKQAGESRGRAEKGRVKLPALPSLFAGSGPSSALGDSQKRLKGSIFRSINEDLYTSGGCAAFRKFQKDPKLFDLYHEGYREQVKKWNVNPVDIVIDRLRRRPDLKTIGDFGCGDAKIAQVLSPSPSSSSSLASVGGPRKVHSFDLIAKSPLVTACDIANVPLKSGSLDCAVFCLSLMGKNWPEFLKEALRCLKQNGTLFVAEVQSRFPDEAEFRKAVSRLGFQERNREVLSKMFLLFEFQKGFSKGDQGNKGKGVKHVAGQKEGQGATEVVEAETFEDFLKMEGESGGPELDQGKEKAKGTTGDGERDGEDASDERKQKKKKKEKEGGSSEEPKKAPGSSSDKKHSPVSSPSQHPSATKQKEEISAPPSVKVKTDEAEEKAGKGSEGGEALDSKEDKDARARLEALLRQIDKLQESQKETAVENRPGDRKEKMEEGGKKKKRKGKEGPTESNPTPTGGGEGRVGEVFSNEGGDDSSEGAALPFQTFDPSLIPNATEVDDAGLFDIDEDIVDFDDLLNEGDQGGKGKGKVNKNRSGESIKQVLPAALSASDSKSLAARKGEDKGREGAHKREGKVQVAEEKSKSDRPIGRGKSQAQGEGGDQERVSVQAGRTVAGEKEKKGKRPREDTEEKPLKGKQQRQGTEQQQQQQQPGDDRLPTKKAKSEMTKQEKKAERIRKFKERRKRQKEKKQQGSQAGEVTSDDRQSRLSDPSHSLSPKEHKGSGVEWTNGQQEKKVVKQNFQSRGRGGVGKGLASGGKGRGHFDKEGGRHTKQDRDSHQNRGKADRQSFEKKSQKQTDQKTEVSGKRTLKATGKGGNGGTKGEKKMGDLLQACRYRRR